MRPAISAVNSDFLYLVSAKGFEAPVPFGHQLLRLARLPFRHADAEEQYPCGLPSPLQGRGSGRGARKKILNGHRLDAVGRLDAEHTREEILLALDRAL